MIISQITVDILFLVWLFEVKIYLLITVMKCKQNCCYFNCFVIRLLRRPSSENDVGPCEETYNCNENFMRYSRSKDMGIDNRWVSLNKEAYSQQ